MFIRNQRCDNIYLILSQVVLGCAIRNDCRTKFGKMVSIVEFMYFRVAMNKFGNANPKMPTF